MALQVITLGVLGNEQTLPAVGRGLTETGNESILVQGQSADGTLHTDFVKRRRTWTLSYSVVSADTKRLIDEIYNLQMLAGDYCRFTFTDDLGSTMTHTVIMSAPSYGTLLPRGDTYFFAGVSITLTEV